MDCYERKIETCISAIAIALSLLLLLWNIGLTIAMANVNTDTDNYECFCTRQMTNIIEQIIRLYPDNQLYISLEGGEAVLGTPGEITFRSKQKIWYI